MVRAVGYFQLTQGGAAVGPDTRRTVLNLWLAGILNPAGASGKEGRP